MIDLHQLGGILQAFGIPARDAVELAEGFGARAFLGEEVVFRQGDPADTFYCVASGEVVVETQDPSGERRVLDVLGPCEFFGEIGLLHGETRNATVRALNHTQVYCAGNEMLALLRQASGRFAQFLDKLRLERLLTRSPHFRQLQDEGLRRVQGLLKTRKVEAGELLCGKDQPADRLVIVARGSARVRDGWDQLRDEPQDGSADRLNAGERFAESAFFRGGDYPGTLVMEEAGEVLELEREALLALAREHPAIAAALPLRVGWLHALAKLFSSKEAYLALPKLGMNRPKGVWRGMLLATLLLMLPAILPSIWPQAFPWLHPLKVDTDPENMLSAEDPARLLHNRIKGEMNLHDLMVVGIVNEQDPNGVFNPQTLTRAYQLAEFAKTLHWPDEGNPDAIAGVLEVDIMAPSTVDDIGQAGPGAVSFSWLMRAPPENPQQALEVREKIKRQPLMNATLAAEDDQAIALYLPLSSKDVSYRVYQALHDKIAGFDGDERYYITGLPVAEDAFGVEMFIQMAISAPLAMLTIFVLMYLFFRNLTLIAAPMVLAMVSVICTMALLVISGQTVHIMSSMIPIFIMPIAVLDSVHILSEFFDYYPRLKSRRLTLEHVMRELFTPMFYTSLTTALGFLSLALVPIPPVQVFGLFVAIGVLIAWLLSMLFIPAYIFLVPKARIEALAKAANTADGGKGDGGIMGRWLQGLRVRVIRQARPVLAAAVIGALALVYGIAQIQVNDNPVRWFHDNHEISIADRVLNHHFAGTYMAYIAFKGMDDDPAAIRKAWQAALQTLAADYPGTESLVEELADAGASQGAALFDAMEAKVEAILDRDDLSRDGEDLALDALDKVDELRNAAQTFKQPEMLRYLASLQQALAATGVVGKSVSITDFVKTVNRELHGADPDQYRVPDTPSGVAQALLTYQNSHRPQDIWRFITTDYRQGIVWLMLESGDNIDMTAVVDAAEAFVRQNPPPAEVSMDWLGLNYINVVWQDKMVSGMVSAILGGYLMVLLVLYLLLRSVRLALIAMAPLTLSLLAIYGMLGLAGKAYDMPVAVLSALTIGLAVDFAIHFLVRYRHLSDQTNDPERALTLMFDEPARAILRNLLVVAIGFLPLLLAPLVPYNTVGYLIAAILFTSGIAALVVIPAILSLSDSTAAQGALAPVQHDHNRLE